MLESTHSFGIRLLSHHTKHQKLHSIFQHFFTNKVHTRINIYLTLYILCKIQNNNSQKHSYLVEGPPIAKDEVDRTLNIAIFEVMATPIVMKCVLCSKETATPKRRLVSCYPNRHRLSSNIAWSRYWSYILFQIHIDR